MSGAERISASLRAAAAGGEPALVAYLTAGYPERARFREHLRAIAAAADVVEVGVPFTDPMADGVTIQRASLAALKQGVSLAWILSELEALGALRAPVLLMSYLNPLLACGPALARRARLAGVAGFIVPDLPLDESSALRAALGSEGLALVNMVTPVTEPQRLKALCATSQGFVYAVTMTGTTGGTSAAVPEEVIGYLERVRALSALPVCAGFGIRTRAQVERLRGHVDGVVVGSALVEQLEQGSDIGAWLRALRGTK